MALVKETLKQELYSGLYKIFINQSNNATSGDENEKPEDVIKQVATDMATVISNAMDNYIKSGDIPVGPTNITVTSPTGACVVTPATPAKMQ